MELDDNDNNNSNFNPFNNNVTIGNSVNNATFKQISMLVKEYSILEKNIKKIDINDIHILYDDIINNYYDNSFNIKGTTKYDTYLSMFNIDKELDTQLYGRRILNRIMVLSNTIASQGRIGPGNVCILPQKIYDIISHQQSSVKFIVNPTMLHNDKIIVTRISTQPTEQGISLFINNEIDWRIFKLLKLLKKMNKPIQNNELIYTISNIGSRCSYNTGVIYLND